MAAASSSTSFFGGRSEEEQHVSSVPTSSSTIQSAAAQQKKKRSLPGTPNPDAEVIALSPKTLMATNRFICEVCNKGFQREQNLQLHRRGHNLPWKLKQKSNKEVKRKVYLCPEPSCVHHDPSRALGDLTGIKKHYSRKHGEKKYKCEKCSKKYAVQSDWKAHSKTCGTREYRCDCGTLFSRRDSFITHRAFCDALAQESARHPSALGTIGSHLFGGHLSNSMNLGLSQVGSQISQLHDQNHQSSTTNLLSLGSANFEQVMLPPSQTTLFSQTQQQQMPNSSSPFFISNSNQGLNHVFDYEQQRQQHGLMANKPNIHGLMQLPDLHSNTTKISPNLFNLGFFSGSSNPTNGLKNSENNSQNNDTNMSSTGFMIPDHQFNNGGGSHDRVFLNSNNPHQENQMPPHMSATALLQKAAQMGSTTSNNNATTLLKSFGSSSKSGVGGGDGKSHTGRQTLSSNFDARGDQALQSEMESDNQLQGLMNSLSSGGASSMFGGYGGNQNRNMNFGNMNEAGKFNPQNFSLSVGNSNRTTLDFLGVGYSQVEQQQQRPAHINVGSLDPEMDSSTQATHMRGGSSKLQGN
ncbi:protein indeterminate-domain 5, chloroplastic-like isoform X1 [Cynara cardunculus var. scolymus]|uniref:protein indeterminate-domain 5, chloroplastic-like isoform X1 n=1 Tax=Cynara cardunculus var. scolymus TaxID=59895 RepID=UPI000D63021C|nr:protein indeterminate-domain 5, chloroplastic-like isoform X1 [Cynara cardunculus var. scolymus]XP_024963515.1 protein indeterminate-domain 5, chloroplastic-like isoform X1 [Cynara cardunculus var. scolymus]XP_024963516.1 protein indeterminate-domain 5, chloroplastic-like isoform X1 [Cynara cardunculus var. scolymus]